jgi:hypothetical protein
MTDTPKRRPGRPATGETPKRNIRIGKIWDDAAVIAERRGETMTDIVTRLLAGYVRRHRSELPNATPSGDEHPPALYGERRPHTVAETLDALTGPTTGTVELPHHLNWSGTPTYDLNTTDGITSMYKTVLSEALDVADLHAWLNKAQLVQLWPSIPLPPKVRRLWEKRFPELPTTRATADRKAA